MSRIAIGSVVVFSIVFSGPIFAAPSQTLYYVQAGAPACQRIRDLEILPTLWRAAPKAHAGDFAKTKCVWLAPNTRVAWSGERIEFYFARITTGGGRLYVYKNDLRRSPWRDPLQRDYVTREGAIACPAPFPLSEASQAVVHGDRTWFAQTGCIHVPASTPATRIAPAIATESQVWQVRLHSADGGQTVWMHGTDLEISPGREPAD